jgi:diguanylate cyclase (GGDEF)-like protein/PAS domain S-box-containing protein
VIDNQPLENAIVDALLDGLLGHEPRLRVVAIGDDGLFVPTPPSVPVPAGREFVGVSSVLQLVVPADLPVVIETWERALRLRAASGSVRLLSDPTRPVHLDFIDARHRYGVLLGFIAGQVNPKDSSGVAETPIRPRVWHSKKDQFAVITDVGDVVTEILGWSREDMVGHRSLEFHPEDHARAIANWMDTRATPGVGRRVRLRQRHRDGSWIWFEFTNRNLLGNPAHGCVVAEMVDISDEMAALELVRSSEQLLRRLTEALPNGVVHVAPDGRIVYRNERLGQIVGSHVARTIEDLLCQVTPAAREPLAAALRGALHDGRDGDIEVALDRCHEQRYSSWSLRALVAENGAPTGAVICVVDTTEQVRLREQLETRASYDALTGCRNRASILAVLDTALATDNAAQTGTAVLFLDLDGFKQINDQLGHAIGDDVLRHTAQRLIASARVGDFVGRLGGDEFLIVCPHVDGKPTAVQIANRISAALNEPIEINGKPIAAMASVGVAWTNGKMNGDNLVAAADAMMYQSKQAVRRHGRLSVAGGDLD